jgi:hypothetical protein
MEICNVIKVIHFKFSGLHFTIFNAAEALYSPKLSKSLSNIQAFHDKSIAKSPETLVVEYPYFRRMHHPAKDGTARQF